MSNSTHYLRNLWKVHSDRLQSDSYEGVYDHWLIDHNCFVGYEALKFGRYAPMIQTYMLPLSSCHKIKAAGFSRTFVPMYQITPRYMTEDSNLQAWNSPSTLLRTLQHYVFGVICFMDEIYRIKYRLNQRRHFLKKWGSAHNLGVSYSSSAFLITPSGLFPIRIKMEL
jgi:hypothetical protein